MTRRFATQATALGLAVVTTLTLMSGIQQLAAPASGHDTLARTAPAPAQVVVIIGKRVAQV
jgi:hypothetical protein